MSNRNIDVTCICMTHGRSWLLSEVVESFRRQQLRGVTAELLILNDCREVQMTCAVPGVRVENWPVWVPDISNKTNVALLLARGRTFCFADDDDIPLPDYIADGLEMQRDLLAYRPGLCWTLGPGGLRDHAGEPLLVGAFLDTAHALSHGGAKTGQWNDRALWDLYWPTGRVVQQFPRPDEMRIIYRWDGREWHASGAGGEWTTDKAAEFRRRVLADRRFVGGKVEIKPRWERDYVEMVRVALLNGKGGRKTR